MIINADEFMCTEGDGRLGGLGFGMDNDKVATALHRLADSIAMRGVALQSGRVLSTTSIDNYAMTTLRLTFAEGNINVSNSDKEMFKASNVHVAAYEKSKQCDDV